MKPHLPYAKDQVQGNILVATLLLVLVMNLLGIGVMQSALYASNSARFETVDTKTFHAGESCVQQGIAWLKSQTTPPATLPHVITESSLSHLYSGGETADMLLKLSGYRYDCTINDLAVKLVEEGMQGVGSDITSHSAYASATDAPRYYYTIDAVGYGPDNTQKTIQTMVSVEY